MSGLSKLFSILFMIGTPTWATAGCVHTMHALRCVEYIDNYDGDTITFRIPKVHALLGDSISVRVRGVDCAEIKSHDKCEKEAARKAKRMVGALLRNAKRIDLESISRDKYFRIVADVIIDGYSISEFLFAQNLAYPYDGQGKRKIDWCTFPFQGRKGRPAFSSTD